MSNVIQYTEFGDPEVLHLAAVDDPQPGPGQVRIVVRAAGVNPIDWKFRKGLIPAAVRSFPARLGFDVAGVVDRVGPGVTGFAVGDEVLGTATGGAYAELALASAGKLAIKPPNVSWAAAASLPTVATTVYRTFSLLGLEQGETLLVNGASGGVGTAAVQVAVVRGITVIGTASVANHDYLRSLGAIPVDYGEGLVDRVRVAAPGGVDAALDVAGKGALPDLVAIVGGTGRVLTIADPDAAKHGVRFSSGGEGEVPGALADAAGLLAAGRITFPEIRTLPLAEAAEAHRLSESGHVRGKLVLVTG